MTYDNRDVKNKVGSQLPTSESEIATRIDTVARSYGSRDAAAKAAKVSVAQLINYTKGRTMPSFLIMANLVSGTDYSLDWLATGKQTPQATNNFPSDSIPLNELMLETVVERLEEYLEDRDLYMKPVKKGIAVNALYNLSLHQEADYQRILEDQNIDQLLKMSKSK